jgi:hypothetical protein
VVGAMRIWRAEAPEVLALALRTTTQAPKPNFFMFEMVIILNRFDQIVVVVVEVF